MLNETEIHDLLLAIHTLSVSSVAFISNISINKNLNLNNQIINFTFVVYNDNNIKD